MRRELDIRAWMFTYRSYTPIPFLVAMVWFARPTLISLLIGFAVVALGEMIRFWGVSIAGAETRTTGTVGGTHLITAGPFAYVRNPLYLGNMMMYIGVGIMSLALFPWLLIGALAWFYVQYYLIVTKEEEYLQERFGNEYQRYCSDIRRFVPGLTPYKVQGSAPKTVNISEGFVSESRTLQAIFLVTVVLTVMYIIRN
jgi:protein-S-isoprenylcysteine O-methyltransferase Ste14